MRFKIIFPSIFRHDQILLCSFFKKSNLSHYLPIIWMEGCALSAPNPWPFFVYSVYGGQTLSRFRSRRYYSATILQMSGVRDDKLAIWLAGLTTLTNFLFTLLGVWLVERVGRRKLTLGSILGRSV